MLSATIYSVFREAWIEPKPAATLKTFSSYEELEDFLKTQVERARALLKDGVIRPFSPVLLAREPFVMLEARSDSIRYSTTNVQVAGVDEDDIVKTDGKYAYIASNNKIFILKAYPPEEVEVLSKLVFDGMVIGLFINDDKLAAFVTPPIRGPTGRPLGIIEGLKLVTTVKVYDITNRSKPVLERDFSIDGCYLTSRMIGDYVYLIVNSPLIIIKPLPSPRPEALAWDYERSIPRLLLERFEKRELREVKVIYVEKVEPQKIYRSTIIEDIPQGYTTIVAVNIRRSDVAPTYKSFIMGPTACIYASLNNIYLTFTKGDETLTYRVALNGGRIEAVSEGRVSGCLLNQFSMDEHQGYFRIATTSRGKGNNVYVLDMNLKMVGMLEGLEPDEEIFAVRFLNDKCYLVTFRMVDPFFVIDLKDPTSPKVLGYLKIPGYSTYLHPYDESHIIGIGKEEARLKLSLFDISNFSNPLEVDRYIVGSEGSWSD